MGFELARGLLMRFGYADGYQDAVSLRDRLRPTDPLEHVKASPILHTLEGISFSSTNGQDDDYP